MSETKTASGYKFRKAARLRGEIPKSRSQEPAPWFTWSTKGNVNAALEDGRARLERELRDFGERDAKKRRERAERAGELEA